MGNNETNKTMGKYRMFDNRFKSEQGIRTQHKGIWVSLKFSSAAAPTIEDLLVNIGRGKEK